MRVIRLLSIPTLVSLLAGCAFRSKEQARYEAYTGEYQMGTNVEAIVRPDGERLMAKVSGQDYFEMFPSGGDTFFFKVVDARVEFTRSGTGTVSGFALHQDGKDFRFNRTSTVVP